MVCAVHIIVSQVRGCLCRTQVEKWVNKPTSLLLETILSIEAFAPFVRAEDSSCPVTSSIWRLSYKTHIVRQPEPACPCYFREYPSEAVERVALVWDVELRLHFHVHSWSLYLGCEGVIRGPVIGSSCLPLTVVCGIDLFDFFLWFDHYLYHGNHNFHYRVN